MFGTCFQLLFTLPAYSLSFGPSHVRLADFNTFGAKEVDYLAGLILYVHTFGPEARHQLEIRILEMFVWEKWQLSPWIVVAEMLCFPLCVNMVLKCIKVFTASWANGLVMIQKYSNDDLLCE